MSVLNNTTTAIPVADQLRREMRDGKVMRNFLEGIIHFRPSYKLIPGKNMYFGLNRLKKGLEGEEMDESLRNNKKTIKLERMPAYCDRILWYGGSHEDKVHEEARMWDEERLLVEREHQGWEGFSYVSGLAPGSAMESSSSSQPLPPRVRLVEYNLIDDVLLSDHMPVYAVFVINTPLDV
jgi:hypothetical protein